MALSNIWLAVVASTVVCHGFTLAPSAFPGKASNFVQTADSKSTKPLWADKSNVGDAVINGDDIVDNDESAIPAPESGMALASEIAESVDEESPCGDDPFPEATFLDKVEDEQLKRDEHFMKMAIEAATEEGGDPYPYPTVGAVLVAEDGTVLGSGRSDFETEAARACFTDAGLETTPLTEWCVNWPSDAKFRNQLASATLYMTMEPFDKRRGTAYPAMTKLIIQTGVPRVVIGCPNPVSTRMMKGAQVLHKAGISVSMGQVCLQECQELVQEYYDLKTSKLQTMARTHFERTGRPLGFLHCSVVESDNVEAFARNGNAFGREFGGQTLSFRDFGSYEIAPPPETIWVDSEGDDEPMMLGGEGGDDLWDVSFEDEDSQEIMEGSPMMPWYEQVNAVCATFPKAGNGPAEDNSITARLNGLKWLATHGEQLPAGVERILVMDATDLDDLPLSNDDPNLPAGVDVEHLWRAPNRKKTRILLRLGAHAQARSAAEAAAQAAKAAAEAAQRAAVAIEMGDAADAAEVALSCQKAAEKSRDEILERLEHTQRLKSKLEDMGVQVETIQGKEPIDVMNHLGKRNGYGTVVWRAGCWGDRGVRAILAGAFQWVSAHLAVDATGGKFWQLMLAENAVQAACGHERRVKIFAEQEDISLEYCDAPDMDSDCAMRVDGKPVRHIRLDCRVALYDENRPREFVTPKTEKLSKKHLEEAAPWFL